MKKILILVLVLSICSCEAKPYWEVPRQTSTVVVNLSTSPTPLISEKWETYTVVGNVNIREDHYGFSPVVGVLYAGTPILADCNRGDNYCQVQEGYVIKACLGVGEGVCK